jgi:hypothetical protein
MSDILRTTRALCGVERNHGIDEFLESSQTLEQIRDDRRLKMAIKRAVNQEKAPIWLKNSIRDQIRG